MPPLQVAASEAVAGPAEGGVSIPVFVCSLGVPGVRCPLHIFEPRYRLMMRRCIDSGRREFGMVASTVLEYGTMLYIRHYEQAREKRPHASIRIQASALMHDFFEISIFLVHALKCR